MFYEITSFGGSLRLINSEAVMKSVNSSIPITGYASETYSIIEHIPYINKGNSKITELRAILQRESQNSQTKSVIYMIK
jgi:hypothetical protein